MSIRRVVVFSNPEKVRAKTELPKLRSWLKAHKVHVLEMGELAHADAVITLGGDGSILSIAPKAAQAGVPVLGVNVGRLGLMTAVELKNIYRALDGWLKGRWKIHE